MNEMKLEVYKIFELAKDCFNKRNYDLALKYFNETKKSKNFYEISLFEISKVYFELHEYNKVLLYSKKVLKISKNNDIKNNTKIILAKIYKLQNKINKSISILDTIKDKKFTSLEVFCKERLDCSYFKFNDFFKVSEFSGNIIELQKEYTKIKSLIPQNKTQLFYISRISNYLHNYSFTKKIINKYDFDYVDAFYDNAILNEFEIASKKIILNSKPRSMWIATSSKCNISCKMCSANKQNWSLSKKDVKDIYSYMPYLEHITWWGGEPTISKLFYEMLDYSLQFKNIKHTIITNGQYMPEKFLDIVSKNSIEVVVSIDSANKRKYENIRCGASFDKLKENLLRLSSVLSNELIKVNTVVMKKNSNELNDIIDFAKKFNINKISFIPLTYGWDSETIENNNIKPLNKNLNINIFSSIQMINKKKVKANKCKGFCHVPWTDITFSYSGSLYSDNLCRCLGEKHYLLDGKNMNKYWNSILSQSFRKEILEKKFCELYCPKVRLK